MGLSDCRRLPPTSNLVPPEQFVLLALGAVRALQAADQENSHSYRHQDGKDV